MPTKPPAAVLTPSQQPAGQPCALTPTIWLGVAILLAAITAVYANTWRVPFVYDDVESIAGNPAIKRLWPPDWLLPPPGQGGLTTSGRPVLAFSLAINQAISGDHVWSYHLANALIHAGAALALFGLVRRTLALLHHARADLVALVVAGLWALHPLQTQAVTYSVQRAESLMGLFYLLTFYTFVRGVWSREASRFWPAVSVGVCALGMMTKEVMATAPILVALYDRVFVAGTWAEVWQRRRGYHLALASTWLLFAALVLSTGGNRGGTVGLGVGVPLWAYPLTQFEAAARYLFLTAWPQPLVFEYGTRWAHHAADILPYAALIVPLLGMAVFALRRWSIAGFCGAAFFVILAPTSLAPGTIQMIVEHRMYLPLAAVIALSTGAAHAVLGRRLWLPAILSTVALGALATHRNHDYRSALALWTDTVAKRPENPRAHDALAAALAATGRLDEAIAHGREVVRLKPDDAKYRYNLALNIAATGRHAEALPHYEIAVRLAPDDARIRNNLAVTLVALGRIDEALPHYEAAERLQPDGQFHYNHALALTRLHRNTEAMTQYELALRLNPNLTDAHLNLGTALMNAGRRDEALTHYVAAVRLAPDDIAVRTTLGGALLVSGRPADAEEQFRSAHARQPDSADVLYGLGNAARALGRTSEAIGHYEAALRQQPTFANAHFKLANLLLDLERVGEAVGHYEAAVQLASGDAESHHNLGVAYARLDRFAEARREFEAALRARPDYAEAQRHLAQVRALLGR